MKRQEPISLGRHYTSNPSEDASVSNSRPLYIPVILDGGPTAPASAQAARFVYQELRTQVGVRTDLVGLEAVEEEPRADAIVFVTPGGDQAVPDGLGDGIRGVVAVSAGHRRGQRPIATSLAVLRELGRATMFWDVGTGDENLPTQHDEVSDEAVVRSTEKFLGEVIRMAARKPRLSSSSHQLPISLRSR
jgi:hypothetical protein